LRIIEIRHVSTWRQTALILTKKSRETREIFFRALAVLDAPESGKQSRPNWLRKNRRRFRI